MSDPRKLNIDITIEGIDVLDSLKESLAKDMKQGVAGLAAATHAKLLEEATQTFGNSQLGKIYRDAVSFEQVDDTIWVVHLDEKAMFLEEGRGAHFMEYLLKGKSAKTSKDGHKYAVIPFSHSEPGMGSDPKSKDLIDLLKKELKTRNIPFKKLELDASGSPRVGRLHSFDIESRKPTKNASHDALAGVSIYQRKNEKSGKVERKILTFRVISDKHKGTGKWIHPGNAQSLLMNKVHDWALTTWETKILPEILSKYK